MLGVGDRRDGQRRPVGRGDDRAAGGCLGRYQARAAGLLESAPAAVPGIGYLVGGVLTAAVSPRLAYAVSAVGVAVVVPCGRGGRSCPTRHGLRAAAA